MVLVGTSEQHYLIAICVSAGTLKPFNSRSLLSTYTGDIYYKFMKRSFLNGGASLFYNKERSIFDNIMEAYDHEILLVRHRLVLNGACLISV